MQILLPACVSVLPAPPSCPCIYPAYVFTLPDMVLQNRQQQRQPCSSSRPRDCLFPPAMSLGRFFAVPLSPGMLVSPGQCLQPGSCQGQGWGGWCPQCPRAGLWVISVFSGSSDSAPEQNAPSLKELAAAGSPSFLRLKNSHRHYKQPCMNTTENLFFILSLFLVGTNALISFLCLVDGSVQERGMNDTAHPALRLE